MHGKLAAPIVRDVLKAYFDKKARLVSGLNKLGQQPAARADQLKSFGLQPPAPEPAPPPAPPAAVIQSEAPAGAGRGPHSSHAQSFRSRPRLDAADHRAGDLQRRRAADLQRHAGNRLAGCLVEADPLRGWRADPDVDHVFDRLPLRCCTTSGSMYVLAILALLATFAGGQAGFRLPAVDSAAGRVSLAGIGVRQAGDNIVSSPLF